MAVLKFQRPRIISSPRKDVYTSLVTFYERNLKESARQGGLSMEEAWRLFSSKSWPQGVWRMDRQGSWQTISITSNSLVTEVPIIQGGRSLPHHSTTLGNCIGLINIYGRFSLSWKCNVFRYHCIYFVVLSGVGNCMGLESWDCHDEKKRIKNAHCIVCAQTCGIRT